MTEDKQCIEAAIQGDTAAFEMLVRKYQNLVCAIAFSGTGRIDTSEELGQETFLSAWENLSKLKEVDKFRPWLCSIVRNLVRNYHRQKKTETALSSVENNFVDMCDNPSDQASSREEIMILERALKGIPVEYREPLVLFYRQEQSIRQVAESLDLNEATVKTRLHRGRQMLKEQTEAILERMLQKTAPDAKFTKAVMVGIGTGLLAGAAGTTTAAMGTAAMASSSAGTAGTSVLSAVTGALATVSGKIAIAAAAVLIAAGVATYSYDKLQHRDDADAQSKSNLQTQSQINSNKDKQLQTEPPAAAISKPAGSQTKESSTSNPPQIVAEKTAAPAILPQQPAPARHPDWPGLNEPVENIYTKTLADTQTWIQLPRRFREENVQKILIDNGMDRIEINKADKTVQYSQALTAADPPMYQYNQPLIQNYSVKFANLFRRSLAEPAVKQVYTAKKIGQQDNGLVLVYEINDEHLDSSKYGVQAYVDATTLLPEKIIVTGTDPNSPQNGQVWEEVVFNFSPIRDSVFEYIAKNDETVLPFRQQPCFRGQVVNTMGDPVADANVFIHYFPLWDKKYLAGKTDVEGRFEIKIPPKPHGISLSLPVFYWVISPNEPDMVGWTVLQPEGYFSFEDVNNVAIGYGGTVNQNSEPIETVEVIEKGITTYHQKLGPFLKDPVIEDVMLVMEPSGIIAGVVTDKEGNPIPQTQLSAEFQIEHSNYYSPNLNWEFTTVSDDNGHYEFHGLPALWKDCAYFVTFSANGYVTEREYITLQETLDYLEFNISLERQLVTIRGTLTDNYGIAVANRSVSVSAPNRSIRDCSAQTDPNGYFAIEGCPDVADLAVRADLSWSNPPTKPLDKREYYESYLFYPDAEQKISYVPGQKEYVVEMTTVRPEMELDVYVTDSAGHPLSELKVRVDGQLEGPHQRTIPITWRQNKLEKRTGNNGRVYFDNIPDLREMTIKLLPPDIFVREDNILLDNHKERERLREIDNTYQELYQTTEIPIELVPGQKKYSIQVVVLTRKEFQSQAK